MMYDLHNLTHNGATTSYLLAHRRKCHHLILPDSPSDSLEGPSEKKLLVQATTDDFGMDNSSSIIMWSSAGRKDRAAARRLGNR